MSTKREQAPRFHYDRLAFTQPPVFAVWQSNTVNVVFTTEDPAKARAMAEALTAAAEVAARFEVTHSTNPLYRFDPFDTEQALLRGAVPVSSLNVGSEAAMWDGLLVTVTTVESTGLITLTDRTGRKLSMDPQGLVIPV